MSIPGTKLTCLVGSSGTTVVSVVGAKLSMASPLARSHGRLAAEDRLAHMTPAEHGAGQQTAGAAPEVDDGVVAEAGLPEAEGRPVEADVERRVGRLEQAGHALG